MNKFKVNQKLLFKAAIVFHFKPYKKYELLFSFQVPHHSKYFIQLLIDPQKCDFSF